VKHPTLGFNTFLWNIYIKVEKEIFEDYQRYVNKPWAQLRLVENCLKTYYTQIRCYGTRCHMLQAVSDYFIGKRIGYNRDDTVKI
jgi:hypothetical protein